MEDRVEGEKVAHGELASVDLVVDAVYSGGSTGTSADDPIAKLLPVGNSGGIRFKGPKVTPLVVALVTSGTDLDWPDRFDAETGILTYFGDNKKEGRELHDTPRGGNVVLRNMFDAAHGSESDRQMVPPIFVFAKGSAGREHRFIGLVVPGSLSSSYADDLTAIWRSKNDLRYQNYRATFTVLNVPNVARSWIDDVARGDPTTRNAPKEWLAWRRSGTPVALTAPRNIDYRTRAEQEPVTATDRTTVNAIYAHFQDRPHDFERLAADLVRMHLPGVASLDVTRRSRDGGRDAVGLYRVGDTAGSILLDFSLEAKCYRPGNGVGVRELSRLISRLRHRQFGILVTTSHLDLQAYKELKEDGHPIAVFAGREIANIMRSAGVPTGEKTKSWLEVRYPEMPNH